MKVFGGLVLARNLFYVLCGWVWRRGNIVKEKCGKLEQGWRP
jgi:hypothetical protein